MPDYKSPGAWDATRLDPNRPSAGSGPSPADERKGGPYELGNLNVGEGRPSSSVKVHGATLPWALAGVVAAGGAAFVALAYVPAHRALREKTQEAAAAVENNATLAARVQELEKQRTDLEAAQAELQLTLQVKDQALAEVEKTQAELASKLDAEIQKGDVLIKQRAGGELVVDLVDQILFDSGAAELNDKGKEVLRKVGETFIKVEKKLIQIGGHTDNVPISPKLEKSFASNWELSAARATNVVRFLQDDVKVPGERLVASAFSQFRPATTNATKKGRRKNRRIEVVLLPTPASVVADRAKVAAEGKGKRDDD